MGKRRRSDLEKPSEEETLKQILISKDAKIAQLQAALNAEIETRKATEARLAASSGAAAPTTCASARVSRFGFFSDDPTRAVSISTDSRMVPRVVSTSIPDCFDDSSESVVLPYTLGGRMKPSVIPASKPDSFADSSESVVLPYTLGDCMKPLVIPTGKPGPFANSSEPVEFPYTFPGWASLQVCRSSMNMQ